MLTKIADPHPARHFWCDLGQAESVQYLAGGSPPSLVVTLPSGQVVRVTDQDQVSATCKALGITLPTPGLISP
jgi:hypothetical protein